MSAVVVYLARILALLRVVIRHEGLSEFINRMLHQGIFLIL